MQFYFSSRYTLPPKQMAAYARAFHSSGKRFMILGRLNTLSPVASRSKTAMQH